MIALEHVLQKYTDWQRWKQTADINQAAGRCVKAERAWENDTLNSFLYAVRQYDFFHPAIQVGKDIGT